MGDSEAPEAMVARDTLRGLYHMCGHSQDQGPTDTGGMAGTTQQLGGRMLALQDVPVAPSGGRADGPVTELKEREPPALRGWPRRGSRRIRAARPRRLESARGRRR
eukprot:8453636-Lingulodinium_polyedra.AAC.1